MGEIRNMALNVIVIDKHPIEDGRIQKHLKYLLKCDYSVYHINFNRYYNTNSGFFSKFGEIGYTINIQPFKSKLLNKIYYNVYCSSVLIFFDTLNIFRLMKINDSIPTVIHVHDPSLLFLSSLMKYKIKNCKIVYDRHEIYEEPNKIFVLPLPKIERIFELISGYAINGVIVVADAYLNIAKKLFPQSIIKSIPNYPEFAEYDDKKIMTKIETFNENSNILLGYIGSLDNNLDRDVELLLTLADAILSNYEKSEFFLGGTIVDNLIRKKIESLIKKYPGRFHSLGFIPRTEVIQITQMLHIGFYLIKPNTSYWVLSSPNKIYEYLYCGTIPIVRANFEKNTQISACSLIFDRNESNENIFKTIFELIDNIPQQKIKMMTARKISQNFMWEESAKQYSELYNEI